MPPADTLAVLRAVILGTDAQLSARPATPIQLARACLRIGFELVAPVSWGEELLATSIMKSVRDSAADATVISHCPFVAEALRLGEGIVAQCWFGAAPPAATSRYLRAAFAPRIVHVTYIGRCPGATAPDIDACVLPEVLFNRLAEAGLVPADQPPYFEEQLPPDRARYASLPGGVPEPSLLFAVTGHHLREGAPATVTAMLPSVALPGPVVIDLEAAVGCICAHDRFAASQIEPPRATTPVIDPEITLDLTDERVDRLGGRVPVWTDIDSQLAANPSLRDMESLGGRPVDTGSRAVQPMERAPTRDPLRGTDRAPETAPVLLADRLSDPPMTSALEPWIAKPRGARRPPMSSSEPSVEHVEVATLTSIQATVSPARASGDPVTSDHGYEPEMWRAEDVSTIHAAHPGKEREERSPERPATSPEAPTSDVRDARVPSPLPRPDAGGDGTPTQYPPLREALGELAREERRAFREKRTRTVIAILGVLALIVGVYAATRYTTWTFAGNTMPLLDTIPPRLPAFEVTAPSSDTGATRPDSVRLNSARHPAAPIRRDTVPHSS